MKKILVAAAMALFASQASAVISGSSHDLTLRTAASGLPATKPSCSYCHAAHVFTASNITSNYLWNRNVNAAVTSGGVESKTCLSCHDGIDSFFAVNNGQDGNSVTATGNMNIGTDLTNDHPVAVTYDSTSAGGISASLVALTQATTNGARLFGASANQVECASCHDVHNGGAGTYKFLFTGFGCTDCHNK
jgi:hypothetical protein